MEAKFVKIVVYTPVAQAQVVREALANAGAGRMGNYEFCSSATIVRGRFRPLKGANPQIGEIGKLEVVEEERVEVTCAVEMTDEIVAAVMAVHPYEVPVIDLYPLLNS